MLPGFTGRGGSRQQQHPWGKGKKGKKMSFALKGCKPLFPPAGWLRSRRARHLQAHLTPRPCRQLQLKLAHRLPVLPPRTEPLGHPARPEDGCLHEGSAQKTPREDEQSAWAR